VSLNFRRATINFKIYFYFHTRERFFLGVLGRFFKFLPLRGNYLSYKKIFWRQIRVSEEVSTAKLQFRNANEDFQ
jgi:hypothetical protein